MLQLSQDSQRIGFVHSECAEVKQKSIQLEKLLPKEWAEIKLEAMRLLPSVQNDHFRATVHGFISWLMKNNGVLEIEGPDKNDPVH